VQPTRTSALIAIFPSLSAPRTGQIGREKGRK
jgi:hypothetical protein